MIGAGSASEDTGRGRPHAWCCAVVRSPRVQGVHPGGREIRVVDRACIVALTKAGCTPSKAA